MMNDTQQHQHEQHDSDANEEVRNGSQRMTDHSDAADEQETLDEPVLDGATEPDSPDVNPRKGMADPQLIRDIETERKTVNPYL